LLILEGFVLQRTNDIDRRRRHLFLTEKGKDLEQRLTHCQSKWIANAYWEAGPAAVKGFEDVLQGIINKEDRKRIKPGWTAPSAAV
jgi:DNA-binding MarR family transcriptional regulator